MNIIRHHTACYKSLVALGLPIAIGQLGMIILGFADTYMIGQHSTAELGAASFVNSLFNLCIIFFTGFSYGVVPVIGSLFGAGRLRESGQTLLHSIVANVVVALLVTGIMAVVYLNLDNMGQPEELMTFIKPYFLVLLASLVFVMLFNAFKQFTDSINQTKVSMWILLTGNLLNIVGNYILIYGKLGMPELGIVGAGCSTLISRILMVLIYVVVIGVGSKYAVYRAGLKSVKWSFGLFKRLNVIGWPIALQMGMETASFSLTAIMVGWIGTLALASHQVMLTISQFAFMIYYGLGSAIAIRVSNFMGQHDYKSARQTVSCGFHLMLLLEVVITGILLCIYKDLGSFFTGGDTEIAAMVASLFLPFVLYQFGDGLQITYSNALRGIADVRSMVLIAFIAYFVVSLPLCYVFAFVLHLGLVGVWLSFPFGLTTCGILLWLRYRRTMRKYCKAG